MLTFTTHCKHVCAHTPVFWHLLSWAALSLLCAFLSLTEILKQPHVYTNLGQSKITFTQNLGSEWHLARSTQKFMLWTWRRQTRQTLCLYKHLYSFYKQISPFPGFCIQVSLTCHHLVIDNKPQYDKDIYCGSVGSVSRYFRLYLDWWDALFWLSVIPNMTLYWLHCSVLFRVWSLLILLPL